MEYCITEFNRELSQLPVGRSTCSDVVDNYLLNWTSWVRSPVDQMSVNEPCAWWGILEIWHSTSSWHRETELFFVASYVIERTRWRLFLTGTQQPDTLGRTPAPDLNRGRIHITNLTPGLPSFPCDLRSNPQSDSLSATLQECKRMLDYVMFPSIDQDLTVKTMGYQII